MKNREIELRGMTISKNGFVFGDLTHGKGILEGRVFVMPIDEYLDPYEHHHPVYGYEVIPETVGQYTGLKDKNGVKMFEWDIYIHNRRKFVIVFTKNCGIVSVEVNNNLGSILHDRISMANHNRRDYVDIYGISKYIEVIGNIHEKKEQ